MDRSFSKRDRAARCPDDTARAPLRQGRSRMGACETTPTTTRDPGKQAQRTSRAPTRRRLFLAPDRRPPLAGVKLVRPRRYAAPGAPAGPRTTRQHKPAATRKSHNNSPPARRPKSHRSPGQTTTPLDSKGPHGCDYARQARGEPRASGPGIIASGPRSLGTLADCIIALSPLSAVWRGITGPAQSTGQGTGRGLYGRDEHCRARR